MVSIRRTVRQALFALALLASAAASAPARDAPLAPVPPPVQVSAATDGHRSGAAADAAALASIGRLAFFDRGLSASGKLACATCHDPRHAFAPANALAVQFGGQDGRRQGTRSTPSLLYLQQTIPFVERRFDDDDGGDADDATPTGGLTWDGRVDTLHDQARIPLFNANEMDNESAAALSDRVRRAAWGAAFGAVASAPGRDIFDDPEGVVRWLTLALEAYQQSSPEFQPFSSKYDAYLRKQVTLSPQEQRGLALFDDPEKGNCASCHPDAPSPRGLFPVFTDFGHVATGVPRNNKLDANRDPRHFDLGLCGPDRQDLVRHTDFCGAFITPTLRNVATRHSFFHNGAFHSLREVLEFYVQRDTRPGRWYPVDRDGNVRKFDDLPPQYRQNVNAEIPFKPTASNRPRLDAREINDLIAFLETLTDGYTGPRTRAAPDQATALSTSAFQPTPQKQENPR